MTARRPLELVIADIAEGLFAPLPPTAGLRATAIEVTLPIETRVVAGPAGVQVQADLPQTRTRTDFDLPLGRLVLALDAQPMESRP